MLLNEFIIKKLEIFACAFIETTVLYSSPFLLYAAP